MKKNKIDGFLKQLNFGRMASYFDMSVEEARKNAEVNIEHVSYLLNVHQVLSNCLNIISIGCGLSHELIALLVHMHSRFKYTGIDLGGDYVVLDQDLYEPLEKYATLNFYHLDATKLFEYKDLNAKYDLVIIRHPYFLSIDDAQYPDFSYIAQKIIPKLVGVSGSLFATFYEKIEHTRFSSFVSKTDGILGKKCEENCVVDSDKRYVSYDASSGRSFQRDQYSVFCPPKKNQRAIEPSYECKVEDQSIESIKEKLTEPVVKLLISARAQMFHPVSGLTSTAALATAVEAKGRQAIAMLIP